MPKRDEITLNVQFHIIFASTTSKNPNHVISYPKTSRSLQIIRDVEPPQNSTSSTSHSTPHHTTSTHNSHPTNTMSTSPANRPSSAPPQPLSQPPQTSKSYHPSTTSTNLNPFLSSTRPRIDQVSTQSSSPFSTSDSASASTSTPVSMADRVRSMSTSSLVSAPVGNDSEPSLLARTMSGSEKRAGPVKSKDMFSWFSETVIISQIVRNWPG